MMGAILDRAASILERRFLLNAFLPAIVFFGGYLVFFLWATGRLAGLIHSYLSARLSSQLILLVAFFALAWFSAAFISSQWRNLTRLYEGYLFAGPLHGVAAAGRLAHARRHRALTDNDESLYGEYSRNKSDVMPTRLGNALRAAELYSSDRYGADFNLLWTRLGHLCPDSFLEDMDQFQAALDFLVVAVTGFSLLAVATSVTAAVTGHGAWLFLVCLIGGFALAHVAYLSAVEAAKELGEAMRTSFDLYRNELLLRLRWPLPGDAAAEIDTWTDVGEFIRGAERGKHYAKVYVEADPTHLL
jgi:hypothetical protein